MALRDLALAHGRHNGKDHPMIANDHDCEMLA
jgi:hypothetical protein